MFFLKCLLLRLRILHGHVYLASVRRLNATGVFLKNKFTDKLISALVNEFAAKFEIFVLSTLENYQQVLYMGPYR